MNILGELTRSEFVVSAATFPLAITRPLSVSLPNVNCGGVASPGEVGDKGFDAGSPDAAELSIDSDEGIPKMIFTSEREDAAESAGDVSPECTCTVTVTFGANVCVRLKLRAFLYVDVVGCMRRDRDEALLTGFDLTVSKETGL